jgi:hypothetical protein
MLHFNEFIGKETLKKEYKEFSLFKKCINITSKQAEIYCENKIFDFNDNVISNLKQYIKEYIPKYACGYWNADIEDGELIIGVNDLGLVKGIPYKETTKPFPIEYIKKKIYKAIESFIYTDSDKSVRPEPIPIKIELIEVIPPHSPIEKNHPEYTEYLSKKDFFLKKYNLFLKKYQEWKDKYEIVNFKLIDIFNNPTTRNLLKEYVKLKDKDNIVISILDSDYQLEQISGEKMRDLKLDKNNPYYWVTTYKDEFIDEYKKNKPLFTDIFTRSNVPYNLLIGVGDMIPYWLNHNSDMKLYIIRIILQKKNDGKIYSYYDHITNEWTRCKRMYEGGQPMCNHSY